MNTKNKVGLVGLTLAGLLGSGAAMAVQAQPANMGTVYSEPAPTTPPAPTEEKKDDKEHKDKEHKDGSCGEGACGKKN